MSKKVKLTEEGYNRLINEISYGKVDRAYERADDLFNNLRYAFDDFYTELRESIFKAEHDSAEGEQKQNPYLNKIKEYADIINDILIKKEKQQNRFFDETTGSVNHEDFYNGPDNGENGIDSMDLNYLQNNYPR